MPLVTEDDVRGIYEVDSSKSLTPFITIADLIVTEDLAGQGLSNDRLTQIELYLAAHFAQLSDGGALSAKKVGDGTDTYAFKALSGFASTPYGQTAISLDSSGTLAKSSNPVMKARFTLIGPNTAPRRGFPDYFVPFNELWPEI